MKLVEKIVIAVMVVLLVSSVALVGYKKFCEQNENNVEPRITSRAIPFEANVKSNNILLDSYGKLYTLKLD